MAKAAGSARHRTGLDLPTRPLPNKHRVVESANARKYGTDAERRDRRVGWLGAAIAGGRRDARACFPERRWRESPFVLVERRKGAHWKYGSIAVCAVLWATVWWLFHR